MDNIHISKAPPLRVVIPFYATGALFFLIFNIMLLISANDLMGHYFSPHLLAIVHTAVLGWGTMVIFGAAYELLPVLCENRLYSDRLAMASYVFLLIGIVQLVPAFWLFRAGSLMIAGGGCVFIAVFFYVINVMLTAGNCQDHSLHQKFLVSSALWLLLTVTLGLCLAINLRYPFMSRNHLDIMKLHAHAGIAGWFLQLITGVSVKLVPMFLVAKATKTRWIKAAWFFQNVGLMGLLIDGHLSNSSGRDILYAAICGTGIICWMYFLNDVRLHRIKKRIDFPMKLTMSSNFFLVAALIMIPVAHYGSQTKWTIAYGILLFIGWISSIIMGQTFKTLPFIIWNEHYNSLTGKADIPLPASLYAEILLKYQNYFYFISMAVLLAGILSAQILMIQVALLMLIVTALLYVANVFKIILHKPLNNHVHR
ncbi:hypothetical protein DSL64_05565 [Dyadobacter luteus]|uniref:Cytochrome C oxidase subunit I n=1 Tax=Dyadobacter luteus TaxID=2259619 RepID=A0A3D8YER3_9BACT|nr:hypothetical protein [Dyadobacter luteus]REA63086.1 hypothetical protein DSL64_05565 [Dyadobacter luteus]